MAAVARNGVIGNEGKIPWHLPCDMERFKRLTTGNTVVMGRNTWESIPEKFRPLPNRNNFVISRYPWDIPGTTVFSSLVDALMSANTEETFLIGGKRIYLEGIKSANKILLTLVNSEPKGDVCLPELLNLNPREWWLVTRSTDPKPPRDQPTSEFHWYHRISSS